MNIATLESLKAAFKVAHSAELAKVIVLGLIAHEDENVGDYVPYLTKETLSPDEKETIVHFLLDHGHREAALGLLDVSAVSTSGGDQRPKLRVVEKDNVVDITELNKYREKTTRFSDVVGLNHIKQQIHKKIILPFHKPSLFQRFKKKVGGGVLLFGPPGCGKTLLARATAGECNASFYNIEISDVLDMYIGESEQKLHAIFEKARNDTPCVLFFDELEALAGKREYNKGNASNIVSQFLTELDGFSQNNDGVLVLASTNVPWSIDPAFLRPGRFDRMFFVPPPDREAREAILRYYLHSKPVEGTIDYATLAAKTGGFSGADLENLVDRAIDEAIDETIESATDVNISQSHLKTALSDCRSTTQEWLTTARNYARYANDGGRYDDVLEFLKKHGK
ncbi:MAG: ATP-binding protein [Candidatus Thiothrix putei]|uniref:ATP-binding protein n=1 Tax=Candidatus Thiothrix putei TaxID=3080811 RepID=A0AA95HCB0_9GAMM|nr:MAG: ATP-binding protein [Candidatus Thiothrix putei]